MTPSEIKELLASQNRGANKRLGQHFLIDQATLHTVVDAAQIKPGDRVLEIGPGLGVLTKSLLSIGARVIAVERDRGLAELLRQRLQKELNDGVLTLREEDALDGEWYTDVAHAPWKFVSNLPYAITSFAFRMALWSQHPPTKLVALVQNEVAERSIDKEKTSLLSLMVGLATSSATILRHVPPGAFYPPPKVDSAVISMEVLSPEARLEHWGIDPAIVMKYAKQGFAHPRKRLASNLGLAAERWEAVRAEAVLEIHARAEELSVETWVKLAKALESKRD